MKSKIIFIIASLIFSAQAFAGACTCIFDGGPTVKICASSEIECFSKCPGRFTYSNEHCVESNPGVIIYEHINYGGLSEKLSGQIADLRHRRYDFNDKVSSIKVRPGCKVHLYEHIYYDTYGGRQYLATGDIPDLRGTPIGNDSISSLIVSCP